MTHQQLKEWEEMREKWRKTEMYKVCLETWSGGKTINGDTEDWWLSELLALLQRKSEEIENKKYNLDSVFHSEEAKLEAVGFNEGLSDAQTILLKQTKTNER